MKKILLIYFLSFHAISELTLEITQGTEDPYRVAIIKFSGADKVTTDIQKDGTFEGPNVELYKQMAHKTAHSIVASGGVATIKDVLNVKQLGLKNVIGCIVGKAIIEGKITKEDVLSTL